MSVADASVTRNTSVSRRQIALLAALLAAHALIAWQVRARGIFTFGDDAAYILLSRALRAMSYREIQFIGDPIAARFPPGYPGVLAILSSLFGERLSVISGAGILMSCSVLVALFDLVRRRWSTELGLLVAATVAVSPIVIGNAGLPATETMFASLVVWTLWAADRCDDALLSADGGMRRSAVLPGALAIAAALTRSAGVTLPLALAGHWLYRRQYRRVILLGVVSTLTVGAWLGWTAVAPKREVRRSYVDDAVAVRSGDGSLASTLAHRIARNTSGYIGQTALTELELPVARGTRIDNAAWVLVLGTLLIAGLLSAWRRSNAMVWFVATYSGLLAVWAFQLDRFLDPLVPLVIMLLICGGWVIGARYGARAAVVAPAVVAGLLVTFGLRADARLVARAEECDRTRTACALPESLDFIDAVKFVARETPRGSRIIAPKAGTLYYYAQRKALYWDEVITQDTTSFPVLLRRDSVSYILTTPVFSDHLTLVSLALQQCKRLDLVRAFSRETLLLSVQPPDAAVDADGGQACRALTRAKVIAERLAGERQG